MSRFVPLEGEWSAWTDDEADHISLLNSETGERFKLPWTAVQALFGGGNVERKMFHASNTQGTDS